MTKDNENILISVIVPCRNEKVYIERTVKNIYDSDFEMESVEILIIDGMSDDGTTEVLEKLSKEYNNLKVIENTNKTTPFAFNIGVNNSRGKFILIIGARHIISRNYIRGCLDILEGDDSIAGVGGKVINLYEDDLSKGVSMAMNSSFGVGRGNFRISDTSGSVDTVGTPMYRREIFEEVGMFDEELSRNQDDEFNYRLIKAGFKIWLNCDINISYYVRSGISKLFKQYLQYGYWKVYVNKKLKTFTTVRQLFPIFFILFLLFYPLILFFSTTLFLVYPLVILIYIIITLSFSVKVSSGLNKFTWITALSYLSLHFGYGIGYLEGILDFLLLNKKPNSKMKILTR